MIRYSILDGAGVVIGLGECTTAEELIGSAPDGCTTTGLGDNEFPTANGDYLGADDEFHPLPPRPGAWAAWDGSAWIDPRTEADLAAELAYRWGLLRAERDRRLAASDWTEMPSAVVRLSADQLTAWQAYRAALFDLPDNTTNPADPAWPVQPEN